MFSKCCEIRLVDGTFFFILIFQIYIYLTRRLSLGDGKNERKQTSDKNCKRDARKTGKKNSIKKKKPKKLKPDKTHGQDINTQAGRSGCCYSKPSFDLHRDNFPQLRKQLVNERLKNVPQVKTHSRPGVAHGCGKSKNQAGDNGECV